MKALIILTVCLFIAACSADPADERESAIPSDSTVTAMDTAGAPGQEDRYKRSEHMEEQYRFLTGRYEPAEHPDFVKIEAQYASREGMYMHREAYEAFREMHRAAAEDGIDLTIVSAARSFEYQKGIWERKWTGQTAVEDGLDLSKTDMSPAEKAETILKYSAMPGTSRHHWGTDIDLNALNNEYFEEGPGKEVYQWLRDHAYDYGYCRPYNKKGPTRPYGYEEEKWHWSYKPLAKLYLSNANSLIRNEEISGFEGAEVAQKMLIKEKYILSVNDFCK